MLTLDEVSDKELMALADKHSQIAQDIRQAVARRNAALQDIEDNETLTSREKEARISEAQGLLRARTTEKVKVPTFENIRIEYFLKLYEQFDFLDLEPSTDPEVEGNVKGDGILDYAESPLPPEMIAWMQVNTTATGNTFTKEQLTEAIQKLKGK